MAPTTGRDSDKFMLRLPEGMRDEIKRLATEDGRSMNAQIIDLLEFAIKNSGTDIDEIYKLAFEQRQEIKKERDRDEKRIAMLERENASLKNRLNLWEPLMLQATPEEIEAMRSRLQKLRDAIDAPGAREALKDIALPFDDLGERYTSLQRMQAFFDEIRATGSAGKAANSGTRD